MKSTLCANSNYEHWISNLSNANGMRPNWMRNENLIIISMPFYSYASFQCSCSHVCACSTQHVDLLSLWLTLTYLEIFFLQKKQQIIRPFEWLHTISPFEITQFILNAYSQFDIKHIFQLLKWATCKIVSY